MSQPNSHDFEAQRRETFAVFKDTRRLPDTAVIEYVFFIEELDADWAAFEAALRHEGFRTKRPDDGETLLAFAGPMPVTADAVWTAEKLATEIALSFDFYPDGWAISD
jgi:hypothetical protein